MKILFVVLIITFLALQCDKNIVSECKECADQLTNGQMVTLTEIQSDVFSPQCISCHGGERPQAGLNLEEGLAYANLVNVQTTTTTAKRVVPFNSAESYLVQVLVGEKAPQMPPTERIGQAKIDSVIAWIDRGAENN